MVTLPLGLSQTPKIELSMLDSPSTVPEIPVYRPTPEEFCDFTQCVSKMEELGAHHMGLCKVIPPPGWVVRPGKNYDDLISSSTVSKPVRQVSEGSRGIFLQDIHPMKTMSFMQFTELAKSTRYCTPNHRDLDHLEKRYWATIGIGRPIYGANVSGTWMIGEGVTDCWNLNKLDSLLTRLLSSTTNRPSPKKVPTLPGVTSPYLYYGMWRSTFAWHVEDVELYSINYLHHGAPKFWYIIPPKYARRFEAFVFEYFRSDFLNCPCFLRHKCVLINPTVLAKAGILTRKITQEEGEFMITFPYSYHAGFNLGLNVAEAVNFALPRWIEFGKKALICQCWDDTVRIRMDPFVKHYQPHLYNDWKHGHDRIPHPLDDYEECSQMELSVIPFGSKEYSASNKPLRQFGRRKQSSFPTIEHYLSGDLNKLDLRYSADALRCCRLPFHLAQNPHLSALWCGFPDDAEVVKFVNRLIGSYSPNCAVCAFLWAPQFLGQVLSTPILPARKPFPPSVPHIPELAYCSPDANADPHDPPSPQTAVIRRIQSNPPAAESPVYQCAQCSLTVHAWCYGIVSKIDQLDGVPPLWHCDACLADRKPSCILCYMRGGAMKQLSNPINNFTKRPYWAHLVCALANPACRFTDVPHRVASISQAAVSDALSNTPAIEDLDEPKKMLNVNLHPSLGGASPPGGLSIELKSSRNRSSLTKRESGLYTHAHLDSHTRKRKSNITTEHCCVCLLETRGRLPLAACWFRTCLVRYHVTCAQMAGVLIGTEFYPHLFYVACDAHPTTYRQVHTGLLSKEPIRPGDQLVVRESDNPPRFTSATAVRLVTPLYCRIAFPDGTFSSDTPPEYLTNVDWTSTGPPSRGATVKVLWDDGVEYTGTFQGTTSELWEVRSSGGQLRKLTCDLFYRRPRLKKEQFDAADDECSVSAGVWTQ